MDKIIEISHLSKSYGDIKAVNDWLNSDKELIYLSTVS